MPKDLQVGSDIFEYPITGDGNWGEEATGWATAVTNALTSVQGPNDILVRSAALNNNQTTPEDIQNLNFDTVAVLSVTIEYFIQRNGTVVDTENGVCLANYNGSTWKITQESTGDLGVVLSITNTGQVQYTSTDYPGHTSSLIRFKAKTIDQP